MDEGLPAWGDAPGEESTPSRRSRPWLLLLGVIPWLIVIGLVALHLIGDGDRPPTPRASHDPQTMRPADAEPAETGPADPASNAAPTHAPEERTSTGQPPTSGDEPRRAEQAAGHGPGPQHEAEAPLAAVALAVARSWLTDVGPRLEIEGLAPRPDRYLEHAVVERVERHGDHAVARVLAVVLHRDGDRYVEADARRLAVPLRATPTPQPAGPPWWLDEMELTVTPPASLSEVADPDELLALSEALHVAGLDDELRAAERTPDGWWLARLEDRDAPVWLRPGDHGPVLATHPPAPDAPGHDVPTHDAPAHDHEERG